MAFFGTLIDAIQTVTNLVDDPHGTITKLVNTGRDNVKKNNFSSIAAKASEGILQFPVIISDSVDYNTAVTVTKALERNYSSFIETIISMNNLTDDLDADDVSGSRLQAGQKAHGAGRRTAAAPGSPGRTAGSESEISKASFP